jgi:hypothetical protein
MQCHEFEEALEQRLGEALPEDAAAHLRDCHRCGTLVSDLDAIEAAARSLANEELEPPARIWTSLRVQLESEGLVRTPTREGASVTAVGWLADWWQWLSRPALTGAYLAFLVVAAVLVGIVGSRSLRQKQTAPPTAILANASLDKELSNVAERTVSAMPHGDPAVIASLRQHLDIVDNYITLCEKSVQEEPHNQMAREYLYGAYQQKAELLAMMADRDSVGD